MVTLWTAIGLLTRAPYFPLVAWLLLSLFFALEFAAMRPFARAIALLGAVGLAVTAALHTDPWSVVAPALETGIFLAVFLVAVNTLRTAASLSPTLRQAGRHIAGSSALGRYTLVSIGTGLISTVLLFGTLNLLGVMIHHSEGARADIAAERRLSTLAMLRGFCAAVVVSPLNLPFAMVAATYPTLAWRDYAPLGVILAAGLWSLGWLSDRLARAERPASTAKASSAPPAAASALLPLGLLIAGIMAAVVLIEALFGLRLIQAVLLTIPVVAEIWLLIILRHCGPRTALALAARRAASGIASDRSELAIVANAGLIGRLLAQQMPTNPLSLMVETLPDFLLPALVVGFFLAVGQMGVGGMLTFVLLAAVMPDPAALPLPAQLYFGACLFGWALASQASPYNLITLVTARVVDITPVTLCYRWNLGYVATATMLFAAVTSAAVMFD